MYYKIDNTQITDDIKNILVNSLNINDTIFLIKDSGDIFSSQLVLKEIKHNNLVYVFNEIENHLSFEQNQYSAGHKKHKDSNKYIYMFNINNRLHYLSANSYNGFNIDDDILNVINSFKFNNKIQYKLKKYNENKQFISSLLIPIDKNLYMTFNISNDKNNCIIFIKINDKINDKMIAPMFSYKYSYPTDVDYIFNQYKNKLKNLKAIKQFEDICFLFKYNIENYLQDNGESLEKLKVILNENNIDLHYFLDKFTEVFNFKEKDIKIYVDKYKNWRNIYIIKGKELLNFGDEDFSYVHQVYDLDTYSYINNISHKIYKDKELQIEYRIARAIAKFELYKDSIDPRNGEFYKYRQKQKMDIIYEDSDGIICNINNSRYIFVKYYGYIINANRDESCNIRQRYDIVNKLKKDEN